MSTKVFWHFGYEGKQCLLYERINGQTMLLQIAPNRSSISYYAKLMAQLQMKMHQIKIDIEPNLKKELSNRILSQELINENEKQMIKDILEHLPESNTLCHYDFHPGNIILSTTGPIIIDWLNALVGDEAADIARTSMMLQSRTLPPPNAPEILLRRELRELFHEEYLKEYLLITGMKHEEVKNWMAPTLAFRIGEMDGFKRIEILKNLRIIINS